MSLPGCPENYGYVCIRVLYDPRLTVVNGAHIVGGKSIMKGYLNNPKATEDSITADGWFKSGDIATRDDEGYYYIVDRKKELIKYKGYA